MTPVDGITAVDTAIVIFVSVALGLTLAGMTISFKREPWSPKAHLLAGASLLFIYTIVVSIFNGIRRILWVRTGEMWWFIDSWAYVGVKSLALFAAVFVLCGLVMEKGGRYAYYAVWICAFLVVLTAFLGGHSWW